MSQPSHFIAKFLIVARTISTNSFVDRKKKRNEKSWYVTEDGRIIARNKFMWNRRMKRRAQTYLRSPVLNISCRTVCCGNDAYLFQGLKSELISCLFKWKRNYFPTNLQVLLFGPTELSFLFDRICRTRRIATSSFSLVIWHKPTAPRPPQFHWIVFSTPSAKSVSFHVARSATVSLSSHVAAFFPRPLSLSGLSFLFVDAVSYTLQIDTKNFNK